MKAKEVMELLRISRPTLSKYVKDGDIQVNQLPNGRYDYDEKSVFKLFNNGIERKTYIYARVSTSKQKKDLENQVDILKQFCFSNGYKIHGIYSEVASGISFERRKEFYNMLDDIIKGKVEKIVITHKDRLSRVGFDLFHHLLKKYNCEIVVISEISDEKLDSQEISEEIVSLLHCYSKESYSKRSIQKIKEALEE